MQQLVDNILITPKIREKRVTRITLGAWGCGAFGNNPEKIAELFKLSLESFGRFYKRVVFAIPKAASNTNYEVFETVLANSPPP